MASYSYVKLPEAIKFTVPSTATAVLSRLSEVDSLMIHLNPHGTTWPPDSPVAGIHTSTSGKEPQEFCSKSGHSIEIAPKKTKSEFVSASEKFQALPTSSDDLSSGNFPGATLPSCPCLFMRLGCQH